MRYAISETERRRKIQEKYNTENGITPTTIVKSIESTLVTAYEADYFKIPLDLDGFDEYSPKQLKEMVDTLKSPGPFTVFAPTNAAFAALPAGTVDTLLKPENKPTLTAVLTYHVVSGRLDSKALDKLIKTGHGSTKLKTVQGESLTVSRMGQKYMLTDAKGGMAHVTIGNVYQSNGVIHVIDKVLMP